MEDEAQQPLTKVTPLGFRTYSFACGLPEVTTPGREKLTSGWAVIAVILADLCCLDVTTWQ